MMKDMFIIRTKQGKALRKSVTVPDQSLSIQEILKRYTRGLSINISQREPVYVDQTEFDLEKLSRMNFADKAAYAADMKADAERIIQEAEEKASLRAQDEADRKEAERKAENEAGKDTLDNTLPDDTRSQNQQVRPRKK